MTEAEVLRRTRIEGGYLLTLEREDLSRIYPGMVRYTVRVRKQGRTRAAFRTNTYEYTPRMPLDAEGSAHETYLEWARELAADPEIFIRTLQPLPRVRSEIPVTEVLVIQGSPRAGGNCSIMADVAASAAREAGRTAQVLFPDDLYIRPCIGCYWCYNFAQCTFDDDMEGVIAPSGAHSSSSSAPRSTPTRCPRRSRWSSTAARPTTPNGRSSAARKARKGCCWRLPDAPARRTFIASGKWCGISCATWRSSPAARCSSKAWTGRGTCAPSPGSRSGCGRQ